MSKTLILYFDYITLPKTVSLDGTCKRFDLRETKQNTNTSHSIVFQDNKRVLSSHEICVRRRLHFQYINVCILNFGPFLPQPQKSLLLFFYSKPTIPLVTLTNSRAFCKSRACGLGDTIGQPPFLHSLSL